MSIDQSGVIIPNLKPNKVLTIISITLLTLMVVLTAKLLILLLFANISPWGNDIILFISCCLATNIAAYLIFYKYQSLLNHAEKYAKVKTAILNDANNNLRLEISKCRSDTAEEISKLKTLNEQLLQELNELKQAKETQP